VISACSLAPEAKICVSNACASSLAAIATAKTWLKAKRVDHAVIFACDAIDSFVLHGFHHLRVLSPDRTRPFAANRTGFHLGDAAACLILSSKNKSADGLELIDAQIDSEGHAATRPSQSGESLLRACKNLLASREQVTPDLVIAHGTSTQANDVTEDKVFKSLFEGSEKKPRITGTKWSVGHTLGTAGLLDVIAACEVLKSQKVFALRTTDGIDPAFEGSYLLASELQNSDRPLKSILVTSLGFGGVHAAALVTRV
jgi:3-oxoacyl-[acyl-carrier-protein] synthase I